MSPFLYIQLASYLDHTLINPAYLDIVKIFAGAFLWIGGLTAYMWWREKNKHTEQV